MKHLKEGKKFHRKTGPRKALLKSLTVNLIMNGKIQTTKSKAKETQKQIERLITIAKKQNLTALRQIKEVLPDKIANKLYYEIAPRYLKRRGGYTRILKTTTRRKRDATELVILEFVE